MAIVIKSGLDPTGVKEGTAKAQQELKGGLTEALGAIEKKSQEAEKSLKGMLDLQKIQAAAGAMGALKGIIDKAGASVLGFSESTQKAVGASLELSQQGIALGAAFGPIPALVGGVVGALIGYASASDDAAEATKNLIEAEKEKAELDKLLALNIDKNASLVEKFGKLQEAATVAITGDEFSLLGKNKEQVTDVFIEASDALKKYSEEAEAARVATLYIADTDTAGLEAQQKAYDELSEKIGEATRQKLAAQKALDDLTKKTTTHTTAVNAETKAIEDANKALQDRVAAINAETQAMLERRAVADEAAADRAEDDGLIDKEGLRETREEASALTTDILAVTSAMIELESAIPTPALKAMDYALLNIKATAKEIGAQLKDAFVNVGVGAVKVLFDNIEKGKRPLEDLGKAFAKFASEQLKQIGTGLIGQGLSDEFKAASMAIGSLGALSGPAAALAAVGGGEIGLGLLFGGSGALLGRRAGGAEAATSTAGSESLGAREAETSGPKQLAPVKMYLGPENGVAVFADDQRGVSKYGEFTMAAQQKAMKAPR